MNVHGVDPGQLVAEYAVRLVSALTTMARARSYILGEVRYLRSDLKFLLRGLRKPGLMLASKYNTMAATVRVNVAGFEALR